MPMKKSISQQIILFVCFLPIITYGQTLKVCLESPVLEMDIHKAVDTSSVEVFHKKIYESLIKYNKKDKGYFTLIAKKISFPSANEILIDLKKNISFHSNKIFKPTRNLNADDVIFSFSRQMSSNIKDPEDKKLFANYRSRNLDKIIISVNKVNDHAVLIKTSSKIHNTYELLSEHFLSILSKEYYTKLKKINKTDYFIRLPIGTGPFQMPKIQKKTTFKLRKNKKYHGTVVKYDKLNFYIITDNMKRTRYSLEGKCHIAHNPHWSMIKDIKKDPNLRLVDYPENNILFLSLNLKKSFFKNKEVRKAIAMGLNYEKYLKSLFYGHAKRANHILTPNFKEYDAASYSLESNAAKAKSIIDKNFPDGAVSLDLWTISVPRPYLPDGKMLAKLIKADLEAIGLKVKVVKPDFKTYLSSTGKGEHDIAIGGFANITDQQEPLLSLNCNAVKADTNRSKWCNTSYDDLVNKFFSTRNLDYRSKIMKDIMLIFNTDKPRIPIAYMSKKKVISKKILNFISTNDSSGDYSKIIFIESILKK